MSGPLHDWGCAWCDVRDLRTVGFGLTLEGRAACRDCAERFGVRVHRWVQADPARVVTDFGAAEVADDGTVTLQPRLMRRAAYVGVDRRMAQLWTATTKQPGWHSWETDIEGAAAELAVCAWVGKRWDPTEAGRILPGVVVRWARRWDAVLQLYPEDEAQARVVLVVGSAPRLRVVGFIVAEKGRHPDLWVEPERGRPYFAVAQEFLQPVPRGVGSGDGAAEAGAARAGAGGGGAAAPGAPGRDMPGVSDDRPY